MLQETEEEIEEIGQQRNSRQDNHEKAPHVPRAITIHRLQGWLLR
jgi:hypothetical protein